MKEPLKGKLHEVQTNANVDNMVALGQTTWKMFHLQDLLSAVQCLKTNVERQARLIGDEVALNTAEIKSLINASFPDLLTFASQKEHNTDFKSATPKPCPKCCGEGRILEEHTLRNIWITCLDCEGQGFIKS